MDAASLARQLWAGLGREGPPPLPVEVALAEALERARARWPALELEPARLQAVLARRVRGEDPLAALGRLQLEDLFLAAACERGDPDALSIFEREVLPHARAALVARREPRDRVEEALQLLRQRLFVGEGGRARIGDYAGAGPLSAFARVAAVRLALNLRRADQGGRAPSRPGSRAGAVPAAPPELGYVKARYWLDFKAAFEAAFASLSLRQRALLRLQLIEGISTSRLARMYRADPSTARRWLAQARTDLVEKTRTCLEARVRVSRDEAESLMALLVSQLDQSVRRILNDHRD
jgi:RNA polymerase sigma-70 factor (ECF subfamily)